MVEAAQKRATTVEAPKDVVISPGRIQIPKHMCKKRTWLENAKEAA